MTDYTPEALDPRILKPTQGEWEYDQVTGCCAAALSLGRGSYRTAAQPSGDEVEAVARAIMVTNGACFVKDWTTERRDNPHVALAWDQATAAITALDAVRGKPARKFSLGDRVTKTKGSSWTGLVVGFYSTSLTPIGYAVESENEPGSVQIYPESALASDPLLDRQGKEGEELPTAIDIAFAVGEEAHKRIGVTPLMREVMGLRKRTVHPPSCCCAYCASDWMGDD